MIYMMNLILSELFRAKPPCVRQFSQLCLLLRRSGAADPMTAKTVKKPALPCQQND